MIKIKIQELTFIKIYQAEYPAYSISKTKTNLALGGVWSESG
jgi:hypothetical protein